MARIKFTAAVRWPCLQARARLRLTTALNATDTLLCVQVRQAR